VNQSSTITQAPVNGPGMFLVGDATGQNNPGFVTLAGGAYRLASDAEGIDLSELLDPTVVANVFCQPSSI
jgi:hypothetical protein